MDDRFRPPASPTPLHETTPAGLRKGWAAALVIFCCGFPFSTYGYLTAANGPLWLGMILEAVDIGTLWMLYGYVRRRPMRHLGLRLLCIALALVTLARVAVVAWIAVPLLTPWTGDKENIVTLLLLTGAVLGILLARALWLHATVPQQTGAVGPHS